MAGAGRVQEAAGGRAEKQEEPDYIQGLIKYVHVLRLMRSVFQAVGKGLTNKKKEKTGTNPELDLKYQENVQFSIEI